MGKSTHGIAVLLMTDYKGKNKIDTAR